MVSLHTSVCDFGWKAVDFDLPGVDGKRHSLASARGPNGLLVMFICNHCPYVKAVIERIVRDCRELAEPRRRLDRDHVERPGGLPRGFVRQHAARGAGEKNFPFPYVFDETQEVAKAYGAVCTPDFFGFNAKLELQYRGRLDASRREVVPGAKRELYEAMLQISSTGQGPKEQTPSVGCSIKWRHAA